MHDNNFSLDSKGPKNNFWSGCYHGQQQFFPELLSHGRSHYTINLISSFRDFFASMPFYDVCNLKKESYSRHFHIVYY